MPLGPMGRTILEPCSQTQGAKAKCPSQGHEPQTEAGSALCHDGSWQSTGRAAVREGPSRTHLGEEPPPLPVAQLEVGSTVPLQDLHGRQLLLPLGKGPVGEGHGQYLGGGTADL